MSPSLHTQQSYHPNQKIKNNLQKILTHCFPSISSQRLSTNLSKQPLASNLFLLPLKLAHWRFCMMHAICFPMMVSVCYMVIVYLYYHYKCMMDDSNYEAMIGKLAKGTVEQKAASLKKLLFLYQNARSRIYLYERRITECLELSLLIEEKDVSLNALTLLEKIIVNTSAESDLMGIIRKRLLSKVVLNLGSIEVAIRKISHKCVLEYVRKFRDLETVMSIYLKTALQQGENWHLKLKAINSLHSLLMAETKYFSHQLDSARPILEELVHASFQKEYLQVHRAAIISLIFLLRVSGGETSVQHLSPQAEAQLMQLRFESEELAFLLEVLLKGRGECSDGVREQPEHDHQSNAPSPKFTSIQEIVQVKQREKQGQAGPGEGQLKAFNEVSVAEEFLKKLQRDNWEFAEIQEFAPFLQKCLVDQSIKLFSISKKIVEVIFNSEDGHKKEYYVVLVPCIVKGIGNKRFIVRKNLDKLVRQYVRNHTEVWVRSFVERFALSRNPKVKEILIDLLAHAYKTSPEFYCPTERTFEVFDCEMNDHSSTLKRKVIDTIVLIVDRTGKDEKAKEDLLQVFSPDPYNKILRKMAKTNHSAGSLSDDTDPQTLEPISPVARKDRKQRLVTAEPEKVSRLQRSEEQGQNVSEEKVMPRQPAHYSRERRVRNSQIQIHFRAKKERRSKDAKGSLQRLPELKRPKNSSTSKHQPGDSPVKRSINERNIVYLEREGLRPLENPRAELERALVDIRDGNWSLQFQAINRIRAIAQFHAEVVGQEALATVVNELLQCVGNLRSGVTKLALICLTELIRRFGRRLYPSTEPIVQALLRKSITTSQFMQDELRRCIGTAVEALCVPRVVGALNSAREARSGDIKLTFLAFVEGMIRSQKIYRKEFQWIWGVLTEFSEQPQFQLRAECRRLVRLLLETYKDWKNEAAGLRRQQLQRIDKLLKNLPVKGENSLWIEIQNQQFEKILLGRIITSKYFTTNYSKFEELDRAYVLKRSWKERMRLLNDLFHLAFEYPQEFEANQNVRKYFAVAVDHLDDKNPGLLLNALALFQRAADVFPLTLEDCLPALLQRTLAVFDTRRGELVAVASKMLIKLSSKYDVNKLIREYLRMLVGNIKSKAQIINQLIILLREGEQKEIEGRSIRQIPLDRNSSSQNTETLLSTASQAAIIKSLVKVCSEKTEVMNGWGGRLKELIAVCQRRFGADFSSKLLSNAKIMEIMS